jgi:Flp pilus assembly pilin Flp
MAIALRIRILRDYLAELRDREEGQDLVEYVVLIALIALAIFAALIFFSDELGSIFSEITNILDDKLPA